MFEFEPIPVPGTDKKLGILVEESRSRTMRARIIDGHVVIKIPVSWNRSIAMESAQKLHMRMKRMVERHPELAFVKKREHMVFKEGETIYPLGSPVKILISEESRKRATAVFDGDIRISIPAGMEQSKREDKITILARRLISKRYEPDLKNMLEDINRKWFSSIIGKVKIRDNIATWGVCSCNNDITLSMRLLFMQPELLEYVMVHELSHTKVRGHGKRFWALVSRVIPDYKQRRRMLKGA